MPITGMDRMPGAGLARGTLFDKELNVTEIDVPNLTVQSSLILNKAGEYQYNLIWDSPSGDQRDINIPSSGANDTFTFLNLAQTMTNKSLGAGTTITAGTIRGITDLEVATANSTTLFGDLADKILVLGAGASTISIPGNLTISGTTTTVDTTNLVTSDNIIYLNQDYSISSPTQDSGFLINRGGTQANVAMMWDESEDEFVMATTATAHTQNTLTPATYANLHIGALTLKDNEASALVIKEAGNAYLTFNTANSGGSKIVANVEIEGSNFDIDGGNIDGTAIGTTTASTIIGTTVKATTSILTPLIEFTDGDDAITIVDGGAVSTATDLTVGGNLIMGSAIISETELEILDGALLDTTEINYLDRGSTAIGLSLASKAVVLDANGDFEFQDADELRFGTDNDMRIYHSGTHGYISHTTGDLNIGTATANAPIRIGNAQSEVYIGDNLQIAGDLTVTGTTTTVDTVTMNAANAVAFEGTSDDAIETILTVINPTSADKTITLPNLTGHVGLFDATSTTLISTTPAEINLIDGGTSRGTTAIADGDGVLINDDGTMRMTTVQTLSAYLDDEITAMPNLVSVATIGTGVWQGTPVAAAYVATLNQNTTGLAATATALATARNIGGVSFDGTAPITLPGVNAAGNQNTSGTAAIATTVTVADTNDTTAFVGLFDSATGNLGAKTDAAMTYNADTATLSVTNINVSGTTTTTNTTITSTTDSMFKYASGNGADATDFGFYGLYVDSGSKYAGLFRDASDSDKWKLFATTGNTNAEPTGTVSTASGFTLGTLAVASLEGTIATAAQNSITSASTLATVGTLASGSIASGFGAISTGNAITTTAAVTAGTSFIIGNADMNETDLEKLDGITNGTAVANKAVVLGGSKNIATIGTIGSGAITSSGAYSGGGLMTTGGNIVIPNAGNIGSASDTDAIAISSGGVVTMNQIPVFSAGINVSGGTITGTLATAAQTNITSLGAQVANLNMNSNTVYNVSQLSGSHSDGPTMIGSEASSATNPTFIPDRQEVTTGIGGTSAYVSTIVGGVEQIRVTAATVDFDGDITITGASPRILTIGVNGNGDNKIVLDANDATWYIGTFHDRNDEFQIGMGSAVGTTERFSMNATKTIINNDGADIDFAVDGVAANDVFLVDASTKKVGINAFTAPKGDLHIRGESTNAANDGQAFGSKDIVLTDAYDSTAQLAITMANYQSCYVKVFITGNWATGTHYAVTYLGEFFVQRTNNAGNEPGAIIRQIDNTHNGSMSAQIVDVDGSSGGAFIIRFKTSTSEGGEAAYLNYHIMGQFDSIA